MLLLLAAVIRSVTVNSQRTEYAYNDLLSSLSLSNEKDVHLYPELKRKLYAAASDGSNGELSVLIPPDVAIETVQEREARISNKQPDAQDDEAEPANGTGADDFAPIHLRIYYSLEHPVDGLEFVQSTPETPHRVPHIYSTPSCPGWSRCWTPCVDQLWDRCTWQLDFAVPRYLPDSGEEEEVVVVCSGDLMEKTTHPQNPDKVIFSYQHSAPTTVQHIAFAVGPFRMHSVAAKASSKPPAASATAAAETEDSSPQVLGFCLPGREEEMQNTIGITRQALDFVARDYGSYPFGSFKMIFVDEPVSDCHIASTLAICSTDLLHPKTIVDQAYETVPILCHAMTYQWIGINIIPRSWADTWLINGVSLHISSLFLRRIWGNNEYRFRLRKDMERLTAWDIGMPPLFQAGMTEAPDASFLPFLNLKAPLVLFILDRRLSRVGTSYGLSRALNKIFLDALTGELQGNVLSTTHFLRQCRKLGGVDLSTFTEQWIYGSGCPHFTFTAAFNRKKLHIEMTIRQQCPAADFAATNPSDAIYSNPIEKFEGQITVRIHEADGTPYEHVIDIDSHDKRIDVPFNTKYKRVRRNTKRFQARKEAAAAAAAGDEDAREAMGLIDLGFVHGQWEEEEEREAWKVADWTETEELDMNSAPYEWIRLDADFEWLASVTFQQEPWMWISQLERDRDIVAQLGAVNALANLPSKVVSGVLCRTVLVEKYFFRIRAEAAHALVNCATPHLDYLGLFHLFKLFQSRYCHPQPPDYEAEGMLDLLLIPRANDFSNLAEYFVRRALLHAISRVRNEQGRPLTQVRRFLVNVLRYNDNSTNKFSDDFYVAGLINCIAAAFIPADYNLSRTVAAASADEREEDALLLQAAVNEVERCRELDMLVPSYDNVISMSSLDFHLATMLANLRPVDLQLFFAYTRQGNLAALRMSAFNSLVLLRGLQHRILARYLFAVLKSDESRVVRRTLAKAMLESLAASVATGEYGELKPMSSFLLEGDAVTMASEAERAREQDLDNVLRTLRREVGRSAAIREGFMAALLSPSVDSEARWALLKLAELLFKATPETDLPFMPKLSVRVRMPSVSGPAESGDLESLRIKFGREAISGECYLWSSAFTHTTDRDRGCVGNGETTPSTGPRVVFDTTQDRPLPKLTIAPKKKKAKPLAPEQASGMSTMDVTACRNCLKKLFESIHAPLFLNPVDPVRDSAPNYFEIVPEPMDLNTMMNKLNAGQYRDRFHFKADLELIVRNAKTYTPDSRAYVHQEALALEKDFNRHWTRITKTLEQAEAKHKAALSDPIIVEPVQAAVAPVATAAPSPPPPRQPPPKIDTTVASTAQEMVASPAPMSAAPSKPSVGIKVKIKPRANVGPAVSSPARQASLPKVTSPTPPPPPAAGKSSPVVPSNSAARASPGASSTKVASSATAAATVTTMTDPVAAAGKEPLHPKRCKALIQAMKKLPEAIFFLRPVDPIKDNAPTYYTEISHPMDLSTLEKKLGEPGAFGGKMSEFAREMQLIFDNARRFNFAGTLPYAYADECQRWFFKEWAKALVPRLEYQEKRLLQGMISRLRANTAVSGLFLEPVDPIALGIPHYHDVIPKANARDLSTMDIKLKADRYGSMKEVMEDMGLMIDNARKFNSGDEAIGRMIDAFEKLYKKELATVKSSLVQHTTSQTSQKRKADGGAEAEGEVGMKRPKS